MSILLKVIKNLFLVAITFIIFTTPFCFAEEITLTTIMPSQETLRVKRGVVGDGPSGIWDYTTLPVSDIGDDNLIIGGNVGIGTTKPEMKLHIKDSTEVSSFTGDNNQGIRIDNGGEVNDFSLLGFGTYATTFMRNLAQIGAKITMNGSYLYFGTSDNYQTGITNEAMVIDYDGNVGIGTVTPDKKLDVEGSIQFGTGGTTATLNGIFETSWFYATNNNTYTINHGLGIMPKIIQVFLSQNANGNEAVLYPAFDNGAGTNFGVKVRGITTTQIKINTAPNVLYEDPQGAYKYNGYMKVIAIF